ncbi:MAG TPA: hypothetical protein VFI47_28685 [Acidimicrobiales bacterium]|nr:hypothetical protein [Acidimicrobiales bacterium]
MSTTPPATPPGGGRPPSPPPAAGPWASDNLPPNPLATAASVAQPRSIAAAMKLMWVGAGLTALGTGLTLLQSDTVREQIEEDEPGLSQTELDDVVAGFLIVVVVTGLVVVGLWLWMAWANGQGRSWARNVATGLGVANVLFTLLNVASGRSTALSSGLAVVGIGLAVVILWLLWQPGSSAYYRSRGRPT